MDERKVFLNCDKCGAETPADEIQWDEGFLNALCGICYVPPTKPLAGPQKTSEAPMGVYLLFDADGDLLHITNDLSTQQLWREPQGDRWWGYLVSNIVVRFFDGETEAVAAKDAFTKKLAPKYIDLPKETEEVPDKLPIVYSATIQENNEKALDSILNVRVNADSLLALKLVAAKDCVDRPDWVRSVLYRAIREGVERHGLDSA